MSHSEGCHRYPRILSACRHVNISRSNNWLLSNHRRHSRLLEQRQFVARVYLHTKRCHAVRDAARADSGPGCEAVGLFTAGFVEQLIMQHTLQLYQQQRTNCCFSGICSDRRPTSKRSRGAMVAGGVHDQECISILPQTIHFYHLKHLNLMIFRMR